jgi:hypothetical protein
MKFNKNLVVFFRFERDLSFLPPPFMSVMRLFLEEFGAGLRIRLYTTL